MKKPLLKMLAVALLVGGGLASCGPEVPPDDPTPGENEGGNENEGGENGGGEVVLDPYAVNISELEDGDITEDVTLRAFTFVKNGDNTETSSKKAMTVASLDTPVVIEGADLTFTKLLKTQSASQTDPTKLARVISFEVTGKGTATVYAKSGSAEDLTRSISLYHVGNAVVHDKKTLTADVEAHTLEFHYAGTYYLTSSANVSLYHIAVEFQDGVNEEWEPAFELSDANQLNASELPAGELKANFAAGSFVINATAEASQSVVIDANSKKYDGVQYTQRIKLGGAGEATYRTITINTTGAARITVVGMSSSSSAVRVGYLTNLADGSQVGETASMDGGSINGYIWNVDAAGSYLFGSQEGGINVYNIIIEYAE